MKTSSAAICMCAVIFTIFAGSASARVYKCIQGDTTVFSQEPCVGEVEVIESDSLRANSIPAPAPRTVRLRQQADERSTAHPVYSSAARSRLLNLQADIERWLRSSADMAERARLLQEIDRYSPRLNQIRQQAKNTTSLSVQFDSEEAQMRREYRTNRALLARLLLEHEMERNRQIYGVEPLAKAESKR